MNNSNVPEGWSRTPSGDGFKYNHKISVDGVIVQPAAIAVQFHGDENYAEIYFSKAGAEEYSEKLDYNGNPDHYASEKLSWEEAKDRARMFAEKHGSADEIREAVNAPR